MANLTIQIKVSDDGSQVGVNLVDRSGKSVAMSLDHDAVFEMAIGLMRAAHLAQKRFRDAAIKAAREGSKRPLQS